MNLLSSREGFDNMAIIRGFVAVISEEMEAGTGIF